MLARPRLYIASTRTRIAGHQSLDPLRDLLRALSTRELRIVEWAWRGTRLPVLRWAARWISWLGNGAIYPLLALPMLILLGGAWRPLAAAIVSMSIAHVIYPWLKVACARCRPCNLRDSLEPLLASLDEHSFPSGHAMTLSAASVPLAVAAPALWPFFALFWLAMAWARIACAHHYPSDIVAGGLLGAAIAVPVTAMI